MRQAALTAGFVVAVLLIVVASFVVGIAAAPRLQPPEVAPTRYESMALRVSYQPVELNTLLAAGWEVERVDPVAEGFRFYILRRRLS